MADSTIYYKKNVGELLASFSKKLSSVSATSALDVEIFLSHISGLSKIELFSKREHLLTENQYRQLESMTEQRMKKIPVAYITGVKSFYKSDFHVSKAVLIPRPDTEFLVEEAVCFIKKRNPANSDILDICTGTGCVGISIHNEVKGRLTLSDISLETLEVTHKNVDELIDDIKNVSLIQSDLFSKIEGEFDLITANPPYLSHEDMIDIQGTPVIHEPEKALYGGEEGFELSEKIIREASSFLKRGGALFMELGYEGYKYAEDVKSDLKFVEFINDYAGIKRVAVWIKE